MAAKPLRLVKPDQPLDITLAIRADIEARDWARCHIEGDRARPLNLPERERRIWRA